MSVLYWLSSGISLLLFIYLLIALFLPEKF
jgi:K+-transporting ATPase KdpF subunit